MPSPSPSREPSTVTVVVPARNEEEGLGATLRDLPTGTLETMGLTPSVVVLDGDSDDDTPEIARSMGATVVQDPDEPGGKGTAVRTARRRFDGDLVAMLDGDSTYAPDALPRLLAPLLHGEADVAAADRELQPGSMRPAHRVGNTLLSALASVLYGRRCRDLCTGMWAFRREVLDEMPLEAKGFELEAELFALASRLDVAVERSTVDYLPREGETNLQGRWDGWRIAWWLLRSRARPLDDGSPSRSRSPDRERRPPGTPGHRPEEGVP